MAGELQARGAYETAYPFLAAAAERAISNFFSYDPSQVDGAVAETMVRTYAEWDFVGVPDDEVVCVLACAKAVCLEHLRRAALQPARRDIAVDADGFVDLADASAISAAIWQALQRLSPRERDVAVMYNLMGCSERTTAAVAGTTISIVRGAERRARKRSPLFSSAEEEVRKRPSRAQRRRAVVAGISVGLVVLVVSAILAAQTSPHDSITVAGKAVSRRPARTEGRNRVAATKPVATATRQCGVAARVVKTGGPQLIAFLEKKKPKATTTTSPPVTEPATTSPPTTDPPSTEASTTPLVTAAPTTATAASLQPQTPTTTVRRTGTTDATPTTVKHGRKKTIVVKGVSTRTTSPRRVRRSTPARTGPAPGAVRDFTPRRALPHCG